MTKLAENSQGIEARFLAMPVKIEKRNAGETESRSIVGYGAVFNTLSENLGGFREKIAPGAFDTVLNDDVRGLINHNPGHVLGRTASGTLRLSIDAQGLRYEIDPPDTQYARDLLVSMERGDVKESSFRFFVDEDKWEEDVEGRIIRTIIKFSRLLDVGPVTYPAYPDASAAQRSLEQWQKEHPKAPDIDHEAEYRARDLQLAELEN
jgi:HK97 family phage prohead protease